MPPPARSHAVGRTLYLMRGTRSRVGHRPRPCQVGGDVHSQATWLLLCALVLLVAVGCSGSAPAIATFTRQWDDGRIETLELYADGRVVMNHFGTIDRTTLAASDLQRLTAALAEIRPAPDPTAFPRLTLTPAGANPVVVDTGQGTTGELFLSLLERHRLP
jgi:hypothetical protein